MASVSTTTQQQQQSKLYFIYIIIFSEPTKVERRLYQYSPIRSFISLLYHFH